MDTRFGGVRRRARGGTAAPPDRPVPLHISHGIGRGLLRALYPGHGTAPMVVGLEVDPQGRVSILGEGPGAAPAHAGALQNPHVERLLLRPLIQACLDRYLPPIAVLLTPDGGVQVCTPSEAYAHLMNGEAPLSPYAPRLRVHPAVMQIWQAAGAFVAYANSPFGWMGVLAMLVMIVISGVMGWIWLGEVVPRLADALAMLPMAADWSPMLRYALSLTVSALEIWGVLFMMSRLPATIGVVTGVVDVAFHAGYGIKESMAVAQATGDWALVVFGAGVGVVTALAPEPLVLIMLAATVRLLPLLPWAVLQIRFGMAELLAMWEAESRRYAAVMAQRRARHGEQPVVVIDPLTGQASHVWMRSAGSSPPERRAP